MSNLNQVKPGMPWLPTRKERSQKAISFLLSVLVSVVLLFTTGLNGKLGWVAEFLLLKIVCLLAFHVLPFF